jgi:hypothetical protein
MFDWTREIPLAELLDDPVVWLVMKSDGVDRSRLERLLVAVERERARVGHREAEAAGAL